MLPYLLLIVFIVLMINYVNSVDSVDSANSAIEIPKRIHTPAPSSKPLLITALVAHRY